MGTYPKQLHNGQTAHPATDDLVARQGPLVIKDMPRLRPRPRLELLPKAEAGQTYAHPSQKLADISSFACPRVPI